MDEEKEGKNHDATISALVADVGELAKRTVDLLNMIVELNKRIDEISKKLDSKPVLHLVN